MHHKRRRPKHRRAGCLCKPHKDERRAKWLRVKGLMPRRLHDAYAATASDLCLVVQRELSINTTRGGSEWRRTTKPIEPDRMQQSRPME